MVTAHPTHCSQTVSHIDACFSSDVITVRQINMLPCLLFHLFAHKQNHDLTMDLSQSHFVVLTHDETRENVMIDCLQMMQTVFNCIQVDSGI